MATSWNVEGASSNFATNESLNSQISSREGSRAASQSWSDSVVNAIQDFLGIETLVGIDVTQIPTMKAAIRTYVEDIDKTLSEFGNNAETNVTEGLKGTGMEVMVAEYINNVALYCKALTSQLLAFNDQLSYVEEAWSSADNNFTSTVNATSGEVSSASTGYAESKN